MPKKLVLVFILLLYATSLPLVAFKTSVTIGLADGSGMTESASNLGYQVLLIGWLGILDGTVAWYANVFLVLGFTTLENQNKKSLMLSGIGLLLALSALFYDKTWIDENYAKYADVYGWGLGFYLWLSCFFLLLIASATALHKERKSGLNPAQSEQSNE
jgi:hypothetical protein